MTHQSYSGPLAKTSVRNSPAPQKMPIFGSPPLENSVALRGGGGGMDIFWNYTLKTATTTTTTHTHTHTNAKTTKLSSR